MGKFWNWFKDLWQEAEQSPGEVSVDGCDAVIRDTTVTPEAELDMHVLFADVNTKDYVAVEDRKKEWEALFRA